MDVCSTLPANFNITNLNTLRLTVRQEDTLKMPEHSGSMLRGAFGVALRKLTCITDLPECKDCPIKQLCKFPRIFEAPALTASTVQVVNPYVIHVPTTDNEHSTVFKTQDIWHFGMTIMGAATSETAIIVKAWQRALQTGLGAHTPYKRATLLQVKCEDTVIYSLPGSSLGIHAPADGRVVCASHALETNLPMTNLPVKLTLRFLTPFRYQQDNRIVSHSDKLDSTTFIASLYNRIRLCQENHSSDQVWDIGYDSYHSFKRDIQTLAIDVDVAPNHVLRRSNRQQRKMQLYGLQGDIHLTGDSQTINRLMPALRLGERLHIGKNTTMGLGQYQLLLAYTSASL